MSDLYGSNIRVPGFPDMLAQVWRISGDLFFVQHWGSEDDLIASGVATKEMLMPAQRKRGEPRTRRDADGDRFSINRTWVTRGGQPVRRYRVLRRGVPRAKAMRLHGVAEAFAHYERDDRPQRHPYDVAMQKVAGMLNAITEQKIVSKHSHIRLVVDNTKIA